MKNVAAFLEKSGDLICGIAAHLQHPVFRWVFRDAAESNTPALQMNEEQDIVRGQAPPGEHFNGEEINACQHDHVRSNEVLPVRALALLRRRCDTVTAKDVAYGLIGNNMTQISQRSNDAVVTPAGILFRHLHNQVGDFMAHPWPTRVGTEFRTVELLGDKSAVPSEDCVRLCHARYVFQRFAAEPLANLSQRRPLRIGQSQSSGQVRSEYAVFDSEVFVAQQQLLVNEPGYICQQARPGIVLHAGCPSSHAHRLSNLTLRVLQCANAGSRAEKRLLEFDDGDDDATGWPGPTFGPTTSQKPAQIGPTQPNSRNRRVS